MPDRPRYLKPGVVPAAASATAGLALCRLFDVLVPNWWAVSLPALVVACAYLSSPRRSVGGRTEAAMNSPLIPPRVSFTLTDAEYAALAVNAHDARCATCRKAERCPVGARYEAAALQCNDDLPHMPAL